MRKVTQISHLYQNLWKLKPQHPNLIFYLFKRQPFQIISVSTNADTKSLNLPSLKLTAPNSTATKKAFAPPRIRSPKRKKNVTINSVDFINYSSFFLFFDRN